MNKIILSTLNFKFPFFLTACQCLFATIVTQFLSFTTSYLQSVNERKVSFMVFLQKIVPISIFFAIGLASSNSAYAYLSVAYIQMLKSFTSVPTLLVAFLIGREKPSWTQLGLVCLISCGVALSSVGEVKFSFLGFFLQV